MRLLAFSAAAMAAGVLALAPVGDAEACGGTFCDNSPGPTMGDPQSMPVDQTGENIVFVMGEDRVEAHIQIQYDPDTDAEKFAWIVPVMAVPDVRVGSDQFFLNIINSTAPSYGFQRFFQQCGGGGGFDDGGFGGGGGGDGDGWCDGGGVGGDAFDDGGGGTSGAGDGFGEDDGGTTGGGVDVVRQSSVGAFDFAIVEAIDTTELMTWLDDNEYYADPLAEPILDEYIAVGAKFVAFRLTQGSAVGEIHPVVLDYEGTEPCIPIRLTRIAAVDDMDIRAFFLGSERVVPTNYTHVELNPLKVDWLGLGQNYKDVVVQAIDEAELGHAFVTEYAGMSTIVPRDGLFDERWDYEAFFDVPVVQIPDVLEQQGLLSCGVDCEFNHPLIQGILEAHLPPPEGVLSEEFYSCMECFDDSPGLATFEAKVFMDDIYVRIVAPGARANEILDASSYLTRLYTTLSPHEMTLDPMFREEAALDDVIGAPFISRLDNRCDGSQTATLPTDVPYLVNLGTLDSWPDIFPERMPWTLRADNFGAEGEQRETVLDNTALIDELLAEWNAVFVGVDLRPTFSCHDDAGHDGGDDAGGCGCRTDRSGWGGLLMLLGIGIALSARARRRSRAGAKKSAA